MYTFNHNTCHLYNLIRLYFTLLYYTAFTQIIYFKVYTLVELFLVSYVYRYMLNYATVQVHYRPTITPITPYLVVPVDKSMLLLSSNVSSRNPSNSISRPVTSKQFFDCVRHNLATSAPSTQAQAQQGQLGQHGQ